MMVTPRTIVLLIVVALVGIAAAAAPTCNDAAKFYKKGKLYEVLGVKKSSNSKDIRKAFKKMSIQCHPDKDRENPQADDNFIAISGAYETLSNEEERRKYDQYGMNPNGGAAGPGGHSSSGWRPKDFQDINVDDIFRSFFSGGGSGRAGGGSGGSGGKSGFQFSFGGSGGGAGAGGKKARHGGGDETDSMFDDLFSGFSFGSRKAGGKKAGSPGRAKQQQGFGMGMDDLFGGMFGGGSAGAPPPGKNSFFSQQQRQQQQQSNAKTSSSKTSSSQKTTPKPEKPQQPKKKGKSTQTHRCRFSLDGGEICD